MLREDRWLAERLGRAAFTVTGALPGRWEPGFYQARASAGNVARLRALGAAGFHLADVSLRFARPAGRLDAGGVRVADARPEHHQALLAVAGRAFEYDRFHLDPAIPDTTADRIKRDWVASYLDGSRGDRLVVAERDGRAAGFLAELRRDDVSVIDLIAVDREFRGAGVAAALIASVAERPLVVGTQAANPTAARVYERLGFVLQGAEAVMHKHVGGV